jgi:hypothetical protein
MAVLRHFEKKQAEENPFHMTAQPSQLLPPLARKISPAVKKKPKVLSVFPFEKNSDTMSHYSFNRQSSVPQMQRRSNTILSPIEQSRNAEGFKANQTQHASCDNAVKSN